MKKIIILIFIFSHNWIFCQNDSIINDPIQDSSKLTSCQCYPLDHNLVNYGSVVRGKVVKIKDDRFIVKTEDWYKKKKKLNFGRNVTVHFAEGKNYFNNGNKDYKLELDKDYIFILGNTKWRFSSLVLRNPYSRFIIQNDSLFIPFEILQKVEIPKEIEIKQKNTFNDPLYGFGYKISVFDFHMLSDILNDNFKKIDMRIVKIENSKVYTDPLTISLINHMDQNLK